MNNLDNLPEQTLAKLQDVLNDIENHIGNLCKINIIKLNEHPNNSSFPSRNFGFGDTDISMEIYDATNEYKELEGIYTLYNNYSKTFNIKDLELHLHEKYNDERFIGTHHYITRDGTDQAGVCKNCNKWKADYVNEYTHFEDSGINDMFRHWNNNQKKCQSCGISWTNCKYYSPYVDYVNSLIYNNNEKLIAKFRLLRKHSTDNSINISI